MGSDFFKWSIARACRDWGMSDRRECSTMGEERANLSATDPALDCGLRREVEMNVVPRGDGGAVQRGGLVMPSAERLRDLLVDTVADGLHDLGFNDSTGRI